MRYWAISNETNIVVNLLLWDGVSEYNPEGVTLYKYEDLPQARLGYRKNNDKWEFYDNELEIWTEVI